MSVMNQSFIESLLAGGFSQAPYPGLSYRRQFGVDGEGAVYLEDLGLGSYSVAVYRPAGHQVFFQTYEVFAIAADVALEKAAEAHV